MVTSINLRMHLNKSQQDNGLADDIALRASTGIRLKAPIPGKSACMRAESEVSKFSQGSSPVFTSPKGTAEN